MRSELAFTGRTGTTAELAVREGGLVKTIPPHQDGQRQKKSGVREGPQVSTTTPPTRTERDSGAVESEVREEDQVTKPTPLTRMDKGSRAVVSGVGGE